jgi:hypothetical protein
MLFMPIYMYRIDVRSFVEKYPEIYAIFLQAHNLEMRCETSIKLLNGY